MVPQSQSQSQPCPSHHLILHLPGAQAERPECASAAALGRYQLSLGLQHDVQPNSHPSWFLQSRNSSKRLEVLQQTKYIHLRACSGEKRSQTYSEASECLCTAFKFLPTVTEVTSWISPPGFLELSFLCSATTVCSALLKPPLRHPSLCSLSREGDSGNFRAFKTTGGIFSRQKKKT